MESVTSPDGTRIAYERSGEGPPLVLVHGTTADHTTWERVVPDLAERFTVYAVDRRGRGESGDGEGYAIEREFADVVAVCGATDGPVNLLGHSYGGLCALGAAPEVADLRRLVLYEPPFFADGESPGRGDVLDRMWELLEAGEHEAVLESFFVDVTGAEDRLEVYRDLPTWERRVAAAQTIPREIGSLGGFRPDPAAYEAVTAPTLAILGTETREALASATRAALELFPNGELAVLEGAGHAGMYTSPDRFVETVVSFLRGNGD